jgi:hypothetical protein
VTLRRKRGEQERGACPVVVFHAESFSGADFELGELFVCILCSTRLHDRKGRSRPHQTMYHKADSTAS